MELPVAAVAVPPPVSPLTAAPLLVTKVTELLLSTITRPRSSRNCTVTTRPDVFETVVDVGAAVIVLSSGFGTWTKATVTETALFTTA